MARINDLNVNFEAGMPEHKGRHFCRFLPLEVGAGGKPKALLATGMIHHLRRDANRFIRLCIVFSDDPDVSRLTKAGVDRTTA